MEGIKTVEISHLVRNSANTAVDDISFDVYKERFSGFWAQMGGKTTAMRILCGLNRPTSGQGTVAVLYAQDQEKIKRHIGYMSQKFLYTDLKVWENIELWYLWTE